MEVPCLVDKNGVQPVAVGRLPPHLAAMMQTNINVQEMTVQAALTGEREYIYYAAMLDPHTAAELESGPDLESGRRSDRGARGVVACVSLSG